MTAARPRWDGRLLVVGSGLIGTSLGLAARAAGADVLLADSDPSRVDLAASLGAGRAAAEALSDGAPADLMIIAAPPAAIGPIALEALSQRVAATVSHVGSVQTRPQVYLETQSADLSRYVGSHPIAGRELSGPSHADADLFQDRPWVVCPAGATAPDATDTVLALARSCGAHPVLLDPDTHDELFARLSHVPQLVASALAASLTELTPEGAALAGAGVRDTTRLADSDPALWAEIAAANAAPVAAGIRAVAEPLLALAAALESVDDPHAAVRRLVEDGRRGRALLPGKHGGAPTVLAEVQVLVPDQPGALADLLAAVALEHINLEDLRVDHSPEQQVGIAELVVSSSARDALISALRGAGWTVTSGASTAL
jgi:prephenate dehydrogenase